MAPKPRKRFTFPCPLRHPVLKAGRRQLLVCTCKPLCNPPVRSRRRTAAETCRGFTRGASLCCISKCNCAGHGPCAEKLVSVRLCVKLSSRAKFLHAGPHVRKSHLEFTFQLRLRQGKVRSFSKFEYYKALVSMYFDIYRENAVGLADNHIASN